jgi:RNA polymerase sigma-70 factor (sigma-E family)
MGPTRQGTSVGEDTTGARAGRDADFTAFVDASWDRLHRYGYVLTGSPAEAEELVQETLVKVYLAWHRITAEGSPLAYTRSAMARTHVSRWRALTRRTALEERLHLDRRRPSDEPLQSRAEDRDAVWRLLALLPPRQRAVVVLRYYEDLSERATADALGCSVGTVKSQLSRALQSLRGQEAALALVKEESR